MGCYRVTVPKGGGGVMLTGESLVSALLATKGVAVQGPPRIAPNGVSSPPPKYYIYIYIGLGGGREKPRLGGVGFPHPPEKGHTKIYKYIYLGA